MSSPTFEPRVLHEDEGLIAVDKPAGMATAAGGGIDDDASLHAWVTRHVGARTFITQRTISRSWAPKLSLVYGADVSRPSVA